MFINRKINHPKAICNAFFNSNWGRRLVPLLTSAQGMRTFVNRGQVFSAFHRRGKEMMTLRTVTTDCSLREKRWPYRIYRKLEHNFSNTEEKILTCFNTGTVHLLLFWVLTNKCTIISQINTLPHVSTLSCHPQGVCNQCLVKLHKYFKCCCL